MGWELWNLVSTLGALMIAASVAVFILNAFLARRYGERANADPWDAHTLEWATTSPPPAHNFDAVPVVRTRRPVWDLKYGEAQQLTAPRDVKAAGSPDEGDHHH